jgi:hypothetical protein
VFEGFVDGRQWFVLVDLGVEAVCGVLGALVDLSEQHGSRCATLKIAMVAVTAAYAAAVAALRPSNTMHDAVLGYGNAAVGVAASVAVLLSPTLGPSFAYAQGITAVVLAVASFAAVMVSGRILRRFVALWCRPRSSRRPSATTRFPLERVPRTAKERHRNLELAVLCICGCAKRDLCDPHSDVGYRE